MNLFSSQNVHFLYLKGTAVERAQRHGALLKQIIPHGALKALAEKNTALIQRAPGILSRPLFQKAILKLYHNGLIQYLKGRLPAETLDIVHAFALAAEVPLEMCIEGFFQSDALMLLTRTSLMKVLLREWPIESAVEGLPGCTSGVVLKDLTLNRKLLVARNLDYPVVGAWEKNLAVLFQEPTENKHIPFISFTSAGIHTGGITAMNEEGLTLSTHAHFGKKVSLHGTTITWLGNTIIEKAKCIDEAVDFIRKTPRISNWAFVLSSAQENRAVVVEMTPDQHYVRESSRGLLSHSNFFHYPPFQAEEAWLCGAYYEDLKARKCAMQTRLEEKKDRVSARDLMESLGDHQDRLVNMERVLGNTTSAPSTVQSIVMEPESQMFWMSNRPSAPAGLGPFVEWDGCEIWKNFRKQKKFDIEARVYTVREKPAALLKAIEAYQEAYQLWTMGGRTPAQCALIVRALKKACEYYPEDAHLWMQWGLFSFYIQEFHQSRFCFERARTMPMQPHLIQVCDLFLARIDDLFGERAKALARYRRWEEVQDPKLKKAYRQGLKRKYSIKKISTLILEFQFPDVFQY